MKIFFLRSLSCVLLVLYPFIAWADKWKAPIEGGFIWQPKVESTPSGQYRLLGNDNNERLLAIGATSEEAIQFEDALVKELCVAHWDSNGDGELSYAEAAAITDLGEVFQGKGITVFNELHFFTGLRSIGIGAFFDCSLTSILFPESVVEINYAFYGCQLTSISIPSSVTKIYPGTFYGCGAPTSIDVAPNNPIYDSRENCNAIIETASNTLIAGCQHTIIPESVTSIGVCAFATRDGLTSITIPESVTSIGSYAFYACNSLTHFTIPQNVTSIGWKAFWACSSLTSVTIPANVTKIGSEVFEACDGLTSIMVDSNNKIYDSRDNCNAIIETASSTLIQGCQNTVIPEGINSISAYAFAGHDYLTTISIPESVTTIGDYAFCWCYGLSSVTSYIENPFEIDDLTFCEIGDATTLYVPAGTKTKYLNEGWTEEVFKGGIVDMGDKTITILSNNYGQIEYNDILLRNGKDSLLVQFNSDVNLYFTPDEGFAVESVVVNGTNNVTDQLYDGRLILPRVKNNILLEVTFELTDFSKLGDVNTDSRVSVADVVLTANHVLGRNPSPFNERLADANNDGNVNVDDLTEEVAIITKSTVPQQHQKTPPSSQTERISANSLTIDAGEQASLQLIFQNTGSSWTAYQLFLTLPEGIELVTDKDNYLYSLSNRHNDSHSLTIIRQTSRNYLLVCYSPQNTCLTDTTGILLTLQVKADVNAKGKTIQGALTDIIFSEDNGIETVVSDTVFSINVIYPVITIEDATREYGESNPAFIYSLTGAPLRGEPAIYSEATATSHVGDYAITAARGTIENAYYEVVDGTLTITKAPLLVTLKEEYSRYEGEENPDFELAYSGWKMDDNESVLTEVPTVTCEATSESPVGEYPIIINGGQAENYELSYTGGMLTVMQYETTDSVTVSIYVEGLGSVRLRGQEVYDEGYVRVPKGTNAVLELIADQEGYVLSKLTVNNQAVTEQVHEGIYVIRHITKDADVRVLFTDDIVAFTVDGINYAVTNLGEHIVKVVTGDYSDYLRIPATVDYNEVTWDVRGLSKYAFFDCYQLVGFSVPASIQAADANIIRHCPRLAAIVWLAQVPLTLQMMGSYRNPNMLYYVPEGHEAMVPQGANVVVGNDENGYRTESIILTDANGNHDFYCPKAFTASEISYQHEYVQQTLVGGKQGWESLVLPFHVQTVTHLGGNGNPSKGEIKPFAALTEDEIDAGHAPFWLYRFSEDGFVRAANIEANVPYILSLPNNPRYEAEYRIGGTVKFTATNALVHPTSESVAVEGFDRSFCPTYQSIELGRPNCYLLNVSDAYAGHAEGSVFARYRREAHPFEAYFSLKDGGGVKEFIGVFEEMQDGIEGLTPDRSPNGKGNGSLYDLSGRKIVKMRQKGIYVRDGKKVVVK